MGTGVLSELTGTHLCDDPPRQDGESPKRQLELCVVGSFGVVVRVVVSVARGFVVKRCLVSALWMGNTVTASQIPEPINIAAFAVSSKENSSKQWNSKAQVVAQYSTLLHMRVVGDQVANHVFIRVRHRSRTSLWVSLSRLLLLDAPEC